MWRWGALNLGAAQLLGRRAGQALELLEPLTDVADQLIAQNARMLIASGRRSPEAETERVARSLLAGTRVPNVHASAHLTLARLSLRRNRFETAEEHAMAGLRIHETLGASCRIASALQLALVTAMRGQGKRDLASEQLRVALERIETIARGLSDPELADSYLHAVDANARTFDLARGAR
jgi:ATP/maltotriose-dependent transcriptional regulator MalT